ncbi:MAG: ATP-binding protein [Bacilli bacterium]
MDIKEIERAIIKKYRPKLYRPFIKAIQEYDLIQENDCIAVCISGGKDSLLLAKLFQELHRHSDINFDLKFISMNPGYDQENLTSLKENCDMLEIPVIIKDSNVFSVAEKLGNGRPCYLCAKMRRGFLYEFAQEQGCNKIALAHHLNDVIETTMLNVIYAGNYGTMMPKLKSTNFQNMELIRPMVYIYERDIKTYMKYIGINAMSCGCSVTKRELSSKRKVIKNMIEEIRKEHPNVEMNIYRSAENVNLNCSIGWKKKDETYTFLDEYYEEK